jgi:hypothetical protein
MDAPRRPNPLLQGHALRFRAQIDASRGQEEHVDDAFAGAETIFRETRMPFHLGVTLLEHGEWLTGTGRPDEARPWLDRGDALEATRTTVPA